MSVEELAAEEAAHPTVHAHPHAPPPEHLHAAATTAPLPTKHYMLPEEAVIEEEAARAGGAPPPAEHFVKHVAPTTVPMATAHCA